MTPPPFWGRGCERAWQARLLAPAARVYEAAARAKTRAARPATAEAPVVCVGNATLGGSGKTPIVQALARALADAGEAPHVLLRGYGGRKAGPLRVALDRHSARDVGDEAMLHAARFPTWIARDRPAGAAAAVADGASVILMDDGYQNPSLRKDCAILAVDAERGLGNGRVFPAGPLREPFAAACARADLLIVVTPTPAVEIPPGLLAAAGDLPAVRAWLEPAQGAGFGAEPMLAFAGIANPASFFRMLKGYGAALVGAEPYPDHYVYRRHDLARLRAAASKAGAGLITTEKDFARLAPELRRGVRTLPVAMRFDDERSLMARVGAALARRRAC